ncbi:hypothetical protein ACH0BF_01590 [Pseudobacillus sp. 179-B 2D1 NHS]|uniref:hypothetical protein n=1 Tax=Pseudobacillus sp. 179-B 2D1 NHS TaxID=3374292 RepID=UPI003879591E
MKKWSAILGAVLLTGGILGACSEKETKEQSTEKPADNSAEETTEKPVDKEVTTQSPEPAEEPADNTDKTDNADNADKQPAAPKEPAANITEATGVFNGMADPHTVEIEVDGQPQSFQVAPDSDMMKKFDQMEEGTNVTFTYKKEGEQLILQELKKITAKKDSASTIIEAKGVFNGVADPHTVEVEVNGQPQSFQVTPGSDMMKKFDQMEEGTNITFTYKKEGEQLVFQELKAASSNDTNTEAKGTFNGMADPHTVEIEVDGQPQSFQVAPDSDMMKKFDQMEEGTNITFTYKKEGEQLILQELK